MKTIKYLFVRCIFYLLLPANLLCNIFSNPIVPGTSKAKEKDNIFGILLGFGQNIQEGISLVNCKDCQFENGLGFGYTFGFTYERQIIKDTETEENNNTFLSNFFYGGLLHLSNRNFSSSYRELNDVELLDYYIPTLYKQLNEINIMNVGLMPYLCYKPIKFLFIRFGIDGSLIFNMNTKHTMELLDRKKTLPDGEVIDIFFPVKNNPNRKTYSIVLQDSTIENINRFQIGLVPMLGGNIYFNERFMCSPSISYYIPMQKLVTSSNLSVSIWRINVEFRYNIAT